MKPLITVASICFLIASGTGGCANDAAKDRKDDYFTSGSPEADQRAEQRIAKDEQLKGSEQAKKEEKTTKNDEKGDGPLEKIFGDKDAKKAEEKPTSSPAAARGPTAEKAPAKKPLYDRLGGEQGVTAIVDDFVTRVLADPRVNWERKGVTQGGISIHRNKSVAWDPSEQNVANLKKHVAQFLALATGGPTVYEGRDMKDVHSNMHVSNAEFDATIGDMKATLDKLQVPTDEQKELLAILESTRPQISAER
jgi:hemoglobin